jgi:hypothetical protein
MDTSLSSSIRLKPDVAAFLKKGVQHPKGWGFDSGHWISKGAESGWPTRKMGLTDVAV